MRTILAMLIAAIMLALPALAFDISGYDFSTIEKITDETVSESGTYTYNRVVVEEDNKFTPQDAYSGLIFGANEGVQYEDLLANTGAVVANKVDTAAYSDIDRNGDGVIADADNDGDGVIEDDEREVNVPGVRSDITRQYIQQKGTASVTLTPGTVYDPENPEKPPVVVDIGFTKSNLAWISGDLDKFVATPVSYAVAGGNQLDAVPNALSPLCQNVWLYEQEGESPITVEAVGDAWLLDAYVGSASNAKLVMTEDWGESGKSNYIKPTATMSGYAERFGGYDDAFVDEYATLDFSGTPDNRIDIDFGDSDQIVSHYWTTGAGLLYDEPECSDFPAMVPTYGDSGYIGLEEIPTWPNGLPEYYEPGAMYDEEEDPTADADDVYDLVGIDQTKL